MPYNSGKSQLAVFITLLTLFSPSISQGLEISRGWYLGLLGGLHGTQLVDSDAVLGHVSNAGDVTANIKYRIDGHAALAVGYKIQKLRAEGEFLYAVSAYDTIKVAGADIPGTSLPDLNQSGRTSATFGFANLYYDFNPEPGMDKDHIAIPYLGLGVGYAQVNNQVTFDGSAGGSTIDFTTITTEDSSFAYQGIAGVSYFFDSVTALTFDYRYVTTAPLENIGETHQFHSVNVGVMFVFD